MVCQRFTFHGSTALVDFYQVHVESHTRLSTLHARIVLLRYHQYPSVLQAKNLVCRGQVTQGRHLRHTLKLLRVLVVQRDKNLVSRGQVLRLLLLKM